jgi:ribosomal protein S18 acetylase RimI-like enzyme
MLPCAMLGLEPMTPEECDAYVAWSLPGYAAEKVRAGIWSQEESLEQARKSFLHYLPEGYATPGHLFFHLVEPSGGRVGLLWLYADPAKPQHAFLYHIVVDEAHRGRGLGKQALALAEDEMRRRGCRHLELNVFGWNTRAISLYRGQGYAPVDMRMRKSLEEARES